MVPLSIVGDILSHWVLFTAGVLSVVVACSLLGWLMTRLQLLPGTTALWGMQPGRRLGDDHHGRVLRRRHPAGRLHAVSAGRRGGGGRRPGGPAVRRQRRPWRPPPSSGFPPVAWLPLAETLALAIVGPVSPAVLRIPAGAFLVPLVGGIVLTHFGWMTIELPTWLLAASYALVGWNVGLRFTRPLLMHAARALPLILGCTLVLIALCGGVAAADGRGGRRSIR